MAKATELFDQIKSELEKRNQTIREVLETYRHENERIKRLYRDEIAEQKRAELVSQSRVKIEEAHEVAQKRANTLREELYAVLENHLRDVPNEALMTQLRTVREFGVQLTESELRAFADGMCGNTLGLRCVQAVADTSGYRMTFPVPSDWERDLAMIEQVFQYSTWAPDGLVSEALEVLPNATYRGVDQGRPTVIGITVAQATAARAVKELDEAVKRWSAVGNEGPEKVIYTLETNPVHAVERTSE